MGLDETVSLERIAKAFERIADAMERAFPPPKEKRVAEIIRANEDRDKQFSDKAEPSWFDETERALQKSRFQERLESQSPESANRTASTTKRSVEKVSKGN